MTQTFETTQPVSRTLVSSSAEATTNHFPRWLSPVIIFLIGLTLYLPGVNWGLPAISSWSQDTIGGMRTLGAIKGWPDHWQGRYPPFHYFILRAAYEPVIRQWKSTGVLALDPKTGQESLQPPHDQRIGLLLLISGLVSVIMGIAAGFGLWKAAKLLTDDPNVAIVAASIFMIGADFTYFAKLGNVDVPSMCWFVWSVYFYVRAIRFGTIRDCILLGLFGSLAISTKDSIAGIYPGMALVLLAMEFVRRRDAFSVSNALLKTILKWQWLFGIVAFALPYLWINGVFHNPTGYFDRMKYWLDVSGDTLHARQFKYANSFDLFVATIHYAASGIGWPMLIAMVAGCAFCIFRQRRELFIALVPCVSYYLIVIERMDFVYSRFLFPMLLLLTLPLAVAAVSFLRSPRIHLIAKCMITLIVLAPTIFYAFAVNLEMSTDSRYSAEEWFAATVPHQSSIGATSKPQYLPRLVEKGYATFAIPMTRESFTQPQPDYLVLSSYDYEDYTAEQRICMADLVAKRLGYKLVASFDGMYLPPHRSWLAIAGWGTPNIGKISPKILVFKREL